MTGHAGSFERKVSGTLSHQPGPVGFGKRPSGPRGDDIGRAECARGQQVEALERPAREKRVGPHDVRVRLGERLRRRPAQRAGKVGEEWVLGHKPDLRPQRMRIARPRALDVHGRGEASDEMAARAPQHPIDESPVLVGRTCLGAVCFK